jgi:hypothetical protein
MVCNLCYDQLVEDPGLEAGFAQKVTSELLSSLTPLLCSEAVRHGAEQV